MRASTLLPLIQSFAVPLAVKTTMYVVWFRRKQYKASVLTCFLLAGMPMVGLGLMHVPILLSWAAGIGIAVYVLSQYTNVDVFPWGVITILSVEVIYAFLDKLIIGPLFV